MKIIESFDKLISSKNDNGKSILKKNKDNIKINRFGGNSVEYAKKSRKSKAKKLLKSQKLSKSRKKLAKS